MIRKILLSPFQKFVEIESFSGILLFGVTIFAMIWANSVWGDVYESILQYKIGFVTEDFKLNKPLILWINDGLMAIFFFLIGLEIKRELLIGELNTLRKAASPLLAAVGGMGFPVALFLLLNQNVETQSGWGIPMATDIAFSLAILTLLGKRVPLSLKVFLTAFAIVDDIGAVLVIALFYSAGIKWSLIGISFVLLAILFALAHRNIYSRNLTIVFGIIIWVLFLKAGIHPTIAGVLLALTVPICQKIDFQEYAEQLKVIVADIQDTPSTKEHLLTYEQIAYIDDLEDWTDKVQSPLQHLEHQLHGFVAYFVMPVFALANAGVAISDVTALDYSLIGTISACLVAGNFLGISAMTYLGIKLKITELPEGVRFQQIFGVAFLAGVGFTMSIFIATLAFAGAPAIVDSAKIGILIGSIISGGLGFLILWRSAKGEESSMMT